MPKSPHIRRFSTGGTIWITNSFASVSNCFFVNGCSYIYVFMAGHTMIVFVLVVAFVLLPKSQALIRHVSKLSHNPLLILANVLASRGAISKMSAHFLKTPHHTTMQIRTRKQRLICEISNYLLSKHLGVENKTYKTKHFKIVENFWARFWSAVVVG